MTLALAQMHRATAHTGSWSALSAPRRSPLTGHPAFRPCTPCPTAHISIQIFTEFTSGASLRNAVQPRLTCNHGLICDRGSNGLLDLLPEVSRSPEERLSATASAQCPTAWGGCSHAADFSHASGVGGTVTGRAAVGRTATGRPKEWTAAWRRGEALGQRIARDLVFTSLLDVLPCSGSQRALAGASGRGLRALSYARLHEFVSDGAPFREVDLRPGDRCAIAMPEGPDLAVCLLTISMRCTVVPMNPWNPEGEIAADLAETGANAVIVPLGEDFGHIRRAARECGAAVINLVSHGEEAGLFNLVCETPSGGVWSSTESTAAASTARTTPPWNCSRPELLDARSSCPSASATCAWARHASPRRWSWRLIAATT